MKKKNSLAPKNTLFDYFNIVLMFAFALMVIYPFIYILFTSISDEYSISSGIVKYRPSGINFDAYKMVFKNKEIMVGYYNSIRYAAAGTIVFIIVTSIVAYPLSFKRFKINKYVSIYYVMTMFLSGGMVPTYLLYEGLGLVNSMWVMVLPGALGVYNVMIFKTYFQTQGMELIEAAYIDGANDFYILFKVVLPLSKPIIATFSLFQIVGIWNNFFTPLLYLHEEHLYPLTMILRKMLVELDVQTLQRMMLRDLMEQRKAIVPIEAFKSAAIFVTILPIICIYPFIQKYFVKGVMIGSLKA